MNRLASWTALLCAAATVPAGAHDIIRHANPDLPIATSVVVPAGADIVFVSGTRRTDPSLLRQVVGRKVHGGEFDAA